MGDQKQGYYLNFKIMEFVKVYFNMEKAASFLFMAIGTGSTLFSLYSWLMLKKTFYSGIAFPFLLFGVVAIAVGVTVYLRTPKDIERVENFLVLEPEKILTEEIPRMEAVMRSFLKIRYAELFLMAVGIVLMYYAGQSQLVKGIGFGLFFQCATLLSADYFAERRAGQYLERLKQEVSILNKQS
jgi:hypothetical protein